MTQGFMNVSTGSSDFADADSPSPENAEEIPRREGESGSQRILFLDDDPDRARTFLLRKPEGVWVQTAEECIARLEEPWDQVHLDHDLGGEVFVDSNRPDCGMEVVRWLCKQPSERFENTVFIIHTYNADAGETMVRSLCDCDHLAVYRPFGVDFIDSAVELEPEPKVEDVPARPVSFAWVEWVRRLARKIRPRSPSADAGEAEKDHSQSEGTLDDAPDEDAARE
jgi:hypothetical protein